MTKTKTCRKCSQELPIESFPEYQFSKKVRYRRSYCKLCCRELWRTYSKPYRMLSESSKKLRRESVLRYRRKLQKLELCIQCGKEKFNAKHCAECAEKNRFRNRRQSLALKLQTFNAYGGVKCSCPCGCNEAHVETLTIDHIEGRKGIHPAGFGGAALYRQLRREGFPEGYRVLCMNCNFAWGHFDYCPKQAATIKSTSYSTRGEQCN